LPSRAERAPVGTGRVSSDRWPAPRSWSSTPSIHRAGDQLAVVVDVGGAASASRWQWSWLAAVPREQTVDGYERQLATNHLGAFALTGRLLPALLRRPGARVVAVSSAVAQSGRIRLDDLQREQGYRRWGACAQSKLADLLFAFELDRR